MRSPCSIDSSKKNVSSGTRFSRRRCRPGAAETASRGRARAPFPCAPCRHRGRVIDARLLQIRRDLDLRDGQEADARIVHLAGEQRGELARI